jgi:hypothetical protein
MAECVENGEVHQNVFEEFKAMIAEAKMPTNMGEYQNITLNKPANGK